jgi:hypothetical protein
MAFPTSLPSALPRFSSTGLLDQLQMPHHLPEQGDLLSFCYKMGPGEAALFLIVGVIFVLFGVNIFKFVVMVNAAIVGASLGAYLGEMAGNAGVGATVGGFPAAVLSWPLMKHAVALMGFVIGAAVGGGLWRAFSLNPEFVWAGALCGGVTFGMLSFLLFRGCVMILTSLQGAGMAVVGLLALIMKYQDLAPKLTQALSAKQYILPMSIFIPALCGWIFQNTPGPSAQGGGAKPAPKK